MKRDYDYKEPDLSAASDDDVSQRENHSSRRGVPTGFSDDESMDGGLENTAAILRDEVDIYLSKPTCPADKDPFEWWFEHEEEMPQLILMAVDYLAIPSSSISTERANSLAKYKWEDRFRLSDEIFMKEMCLQSWISTLAIDDFVFPK